jgi:hypothetical protein
MTITPGAETWVDGEGGRVVSWPRTTIAGVEVWVSAEQYGTGDMVHSVMLYSDYAALTAASARMVAEALLNAADELEEACQHP